MKLLRVLFPRRCRFAQFEFLETLGFNVKGVPILFFYEEEHNK